MLISHRHRFIFIKTRRTGGSTFEQLIYPHLGGLDICTGSVRDGTPALNEKSGIGHMPWQKIHDHHPEPWESYYRFAVERNPWDKVVSSYFWYSTTNPAVKGIQERDFKKYVFQAPEVPCDWERYSDPVGPVVDHLFQYEEMEKLYREMELRFGLFIPASLIKATRLKSGLREDRHYSEMYDQETEDQVRNLFKNEIMYFGYEFEKK